LRTLRFWHEIPADQYVDKFVAPHPVWETAETGIALTSAAVKAWKLPASAGGDGGVELSAARSSVFADFRRRGYLL
jgi:hypothetical protein